MKALRFFAAALLVATAATAQADAAQRYRAASMALRQWNVAEAARIAEGLYAERPKDPSVAHLLGRVRHDQGRYQEAIELLSFAAESVDVGDSLRLARETHEVVGSHARAESEHFVILYPPGRDEILVPWALETLEQAYERIGGLIGYKPTGEKIRVEVISDAKELAKISTLSEEAIKNTGTIAVCKFDKLMITSPKALLRGYEWRDTLAHEYVHLIVSRKSKNRTPIWLHEGIAKFMETAWRGEPGLDFSIPSQLLLKRAVENGKLISFEEMHPSIALLPTAQDAALAFAEVFTAIEFLQSRGVDNVSRLLDEIAAGSSDQEAVAAIYGAPFSRFEADWRRHLRQREYPEALAGAHPWERRFVEDASPEEREEEENPFRGLTQLSSFQEIDDPEARKAAHLGELLRARQKTAAAAAKYAQAIERVGHRYPSLSNKYAIALLELEEAALAKEVLEASHALYPSDALTALNLARAHMQLEEMEAARVHLEHALSVNPFNPEIFVRLLAVARSVGDATLESRAGRAVQLLRGRPGP